MNVCKKHFNFLGVVSFFMLVILAFVYFKERTTFADIAFHLFEHARTGEVAIQNYRFVSGITQFLPVILMKNSVPMDFIQLVYSLSFPIFYLLVWLIVNFYYKAYRIAFVWVLVLVMFCTHTHYWIQSELPQGLAVFVLMLAAIRNLGVGGVKFYIQVIIILLGLFVVAFAHPLLIVPVTFSFVFFYFFDGKKFEINGSYFLYYMQ